MKKVLSIVVSSLTAVSLFAQADITTPSNRNVLLEDLTGMYCGYCPDGAKRADQFSAANPGRVVIIGNHAGYYTTPVNPSQSKFDFRTDNGDKIDALSDPSGYPAGNINRKVTSSSMKPGKTAMSRGSWSSEGGIVLGEPSVVNLDAEAYYRPGTTEIIINVMGYYTADGDGTDNLNVAVLQDNIDSYQSGSSGYTERVQPGGLYRQMDVLRAYLTPLFGETISETTTGTMINKTYTYDTSIPVSHSIDGTKKDVTDFPAKIEDMHIAIFMTQENAWSEVITAIDVEVAERPVGINETSVLSEVNVYPNPFNTTATVEFSLEKSTDMKVQVVDIMGKVVATYNNTTYPQGRNKLTIDGGSLNSGIYYVNMIAEEGVVTRKIVLNK